MIRIHCILYENTYLFLVPKYILLVSQLVNAEGLLLSYKEFLSLYKVPVTSPCNKVPLKILQLF
jgi:hypothetical protein